MANEGPSIKVGSRKSELALIQTKYVIGRLQNIYPNQKFEIHTMSTIGDRVLNVSLPKIGEKSLFTRDLEDALRNGGVDFVVHSLKDLPTTLPTGMAIGAVLEREDARDALVLRAEYKGHTIDTLPKGSIIGTSSLRRTAQIRRQYPHLVVCDIRGNLNTRLAKLDAPDSKFAGIILAQAGLVRMGWMNRISQVLDPLHLLYAVGQGALAVECRSNDVKILSMLEKLMCLTTSCRILAERSFLKTLGGGCSAPVAVWSTLNGSISDCNSNSVPNLRLTGAVWSLDGSTEIREEQLCPLQIRDNDESGFHDNKSDIIDEPPIKRRRENSTENLLDSPKNLSPPVINDDIADDISKSYNIDELIEKHAQLVKKCPFLGGQTDLNGNSKVCGGAADQALSCPLKVEIGQDVMGQCPFINNETKIMTRQNNPPHPPANESSNESTDVFNIVNDSITPTTSKCPFTHQNMGDSSTVKAHEKCPFLQKAVKMFDYADEEKPKSMNIPALIEDVDNLFCGLFRHACHERDLYVRCNKLGQQLAEELIKRGALDIMKTAQAEIHSKT